MSTNETKYNGWTNYATWRVNLEMLDDYNPNHEFEQKPEICELADHLKDHVESILDDGGGSDLVKSYALAFVSDVNWYEIAEHKLEDWQDYSDVWGM